MKEMKPKIIIWIWVFLKLSSQFFFNVFFCLETIELEMQNYFLKRSLTCSWEQILLTFNIDTTPYEYGIDPAKNFFQSFVQLYKVLNDEVVNLEMEFTPLSGLKRRICVYSKNKKCFLTDNLNLCIDKEISS